MEKINGIIIEGKVYIPVECDKDSPCDECDLSEKCSKLSPNVDDACCELIDRFHIFRYSPSLTERLNNPDLLNGN